MLASLRLYAINKPMVVYVGFLISALLVTKTYKYYRIYAYDIYVYDWHINPAISYAEFKDKPELHWDSLDQRFFKEDQRI